ncbi:MAG: CD1247 N-terminal domain-containing protein [Caldicoprobacterales bacterium]|nr:hypothetical protein [Clostridiales bacterium]
MFDLSEKVSYIRGLAEGMGLDMETNEGKLLSHIIDVLSDMAQAIIELDAAQAEIEEYLETIDEDLADMENAVFEKDDEDDDENTYYIEVECPHCHETVFFDEDIFDDDNDIVCPNCSETIYSEDEYNKESDPD